MRPRDISPILRHFDDLPDCAIVPQKVTALITGQSLRSLRRKKPIPSFHINEKMVGNRVGDLREYMRKSDGQEA